MQSDYAKEDVPQFDILPCPSKNYESRDDVQVKLIVAHCLGVSLEEVFDIFLSEERGVSPHYFVPQIRGVDLLELMHDKFLSHKLKFPNQVPVIEFVQDDKKAYHAGVSGFASFNELSNCQSGLNSCSIGIEFHAPGYANGDGSDWYKFTKYTENQKDTGIKLIKYLVKKYDIPKSNILGHSTIAPERKTDPGPLFFWQELFDEGLGYIPQSKTVNKIFNNESDKIKFVQSKLNLIGFHGCAINGKLDDSTIRVIDAYIMQFAPHLWKVSKRGAITDDLLDSLNGFNHLIYR